MQTIERCQARIKELEQAIIDANEGLSICEGVGLTYYSSNPVLKSVLEKE